MEDFSLDKVCAITSIFPRDLGEEDKQLPLLLLLILVVVVVVIVPLEPALSSGEEEPVLLLAGKLVLDLLLGEDGLMIRGHFVLGAKVQGLGVLCLTLEGETTVTSLAQLAEMTGLLLGDFATTLAAGTLRLLLLALVCSVGRVIVVGVAGRPVVTALLRTEEGVAKMLLRLGREEILTVCLAEEVEVQRVEDCKAGDDDLVWALLIE